MLRGAGGACGGCRLRERHVPLPRKPEITLELGSPVLSPPTLCSDSCAGTHTERLSVSCIHVFRCECTVSFQHTWCACSSAPSEVAQAAQAASALMPSWRQWMGWSRGCSPSRWHHQTG